MRNNLAHLSRTMDEFTGARADYEAGSKGRLKRRRNNLGGSADAHYQHQHQFAQIREYARDMDRNDGVMGSLVDRAVMNQLQSGFRVDPKTDDKGLNEDLKARFKDWAGDPDQADHYQEHSFWELCWYAKRHAYIDGDIVSALTRHGGMQLLEGDRLVSPMGRRPDIVHGVELAAGRKVAYWLSENPGLRRHIEKQLVRRIPARDEDGFRQILHVYNPYTKRRITQTRGISAFAPIFYRETMYEDEQFATLVGRQVHSYIALFIERGEAYSGGAANFGTRTTEDDGTNTRTLEQMDPGQIVRGAKGETAKVLSSTTPSPEVMAHLKWVLSEISVALGVPLILGMMDASETNFSGWRGAYEEAKKGWRVNQKWFKERFLRPVYQWKVRQWLADGVLGQAASRNAKILEHTWGLPQWPYHVQPLHDAQANTMKLTSGQMTPAEFGRENGFDWNEHADELAENWGYAIEAAVKRADAINKSHDGANVHWRDVLNLQMPKGLNLSGSLKDEEPVHA